MKRKLFYALVAISSYFTGVLVYMSYLSLVSEYQFGIVEIHFGDSDYPPIPREKGMT
jgi:hypothetical protein